jgi:hypothetical protein
MAKTYLNQTFSQPRLPLGERTVNATTSAPRADFIQQTLEEAYAAYPWRLLTAVTLRLLF